MRGGKSVCQLHMLASWLLDWSECLVQTCVQVFCFTAAGCHLLPAGSCIVLITRKTDGPHGTRVSAASDKQ